MGYPDTPDKMLRMGSSKNSKIIVAMSGGVDSAVAALLMIRQGFDVQGLHMTNWEDDDGYCTAALDHQDARNVCRELDIPLHHVNFAREYRQQVFTNFLNEYRSGRTPNPDVLCNREIKFGAFLQYARRLGTDFIATGHYARIDHSDTAKLLKGLDQTKDQSYFLHAVSSRALDQSLFPIGALEKSEVRLMANQAGVPVYDKPDSTGICFIGERPFREFLSRYLPTQPGTIETPEGDHVGEHMGLAYYTLGQRQGLGIGGRSDASTDPWYVADKREDRNILIVVQGRDHPLLWSDGLTATSPHWIGGEPPDLKSAAGLRCSVKTRYRQKDLPCVIQRSGNDRVNVRFKEPQWAVTPGQYAVFYRNEVCLGGGVIESAVPVDRPEESAAAVVTA